jgi:hypothetical protein
MQHIAGASQGKPKPVGLDPVAAPWAAAPTP